MDEINAIGFDLDQTLYPKSPEVDEAIQGYIYKRIAEVKGCSLAEGERLFKKHYPNLSGSATLIKLGIPRAAEVVQEAMENADLTPFLKPDSKVLTLLKELKEKYVHLAMITGSNEKIANEKLDALEIPLEVFDCLIYGDVAKSDGTAFKQWMGTIPELKPENFLYVGDRVSSDVDIPHSLGMQAILVNVREKDDNLDVLQLSSLLELRKVLL
jgi:FMN phosphatase YigB (HAD superfamily)